MVDGRHLIGDDEVNRDCLVIGGHKIVWPEERQKYRWDWQGSSLTVYLIGIYIGFSYYKSYCGGGLLANNIVEFCKLDFTSSLKKENKCFYLKN